MWGWPDTRRDLGRYGERKAARFLKRRGYRILARNVVLGHGEIDIIAREGDTLAFVEVRTVRSADPVRPEDTVTPPKQARLRRAARAWLAQNGGPHQYHRFDIVAVVAPRGRRAELTLFRDAFPPS